MSGQRLGRAIALIVALLWSSLAGAQHYVAWQAIPGTKTGWPDIGRLDYAARQALSEQVAARILPGVIAALGIGEGGSRTEIVPGGYRLKTDPSFVTRFAAERQDQALLFAAAIGYVLRQDSVLIFAVDEKGGDSLTVRVRLPGSCLTPQMAQRFFLRAAAIAKGLGGGYTAFGCEMLFINLRDEKQVPYSGLDDEKFAQTLALAASGFQPQAEIAGSFRVRSMLMGSDWPGSGGGRLYLERLAALPVEAIAPLDLLSYRFADMLRQAVR